jgi:hypothetical protein
VARLPRVVEKSWCVVFQALRILVDAHSSCRGRDVHRSVWSTDACVFRCHLCVVVLNGNKVILDSAKAAKDLLEIRSANYSDRLTPVYVNDLCVLRMIARMDDTEAGCSQNGIRVHSRQRTLRRPLASHATSASSLRCCGSAPRIRDDTITRRQAAARGPSRRSSLFLEA